MQAKEPKPFLAFCEGTPKMFRIIEESGPLKATEVKRARKVEKSELPHAGDLPDNSQINLTPYLSVFSQMNASLIAYGGPDASSKNSFLMWLYEGDTARFELRRVEQGRNEKLIHRGKFSYQVGLRQLVDDAARGFAEAATKCEE